MRPDSLQAGFHKLKTVFLLDIRILFSIHFAQEHVFFADPNGVVAVKGSVDDVFVFGLGVLRDSLDDVVAIFEVLVNAVNFEFSIFHKTLS